ncbi:hypothetical protein M8818_000427 [Zalaria obscura]|uniref:Uncharacterized protein n=1 Tax=Zalaria obscura TaxID=2024903 RepID=A0ACC3SMU1_9PEZI
MMGPTKGQTLRGGKLPVPRRPLVIWTSRCDVAVACRLERPCSVTNRTSLSLPKAKRHDAYLLRRKTPGSSIMPMVCSGSGKLMTRHIYPSAV